MSESFTKKSLYFRSLFIKTFDRNKRTFCLTNILRYNE